MGTAVLVLLYYTGWCCYYGGRVHPAVILDLCIAPCLALISFSIARKNGIALLSANIFMLCHILHGTVNYIL